MPDRLYVAQHHPPRLSDRLAAHWLTLSASALGINRGLATLLDPLIPVTRPAIMGLPLWLAATLALLLVAGGASVIYATLRRFPTVNQWWAWMIWGLSLSWLGWLGYLLVSLSRRPENVATWTTAGWLFVGYAGAWVVLLMRRRRTLRAMEKRACEATPEGGADE